MPEGRELALCLPPRDPVVSVFNKDAGDTRQSSFAPLFQHHVSHTPRKRFGQHFLTDPDVIAAIVRAIAPRSDDAMLEIGPGLGALTGPLIEHLAHLHAVEIDRDVLATLRRRYPAARLTLHQGDALAYDFGALAAICGAPLRVVGNLPYNISTPLLFHLTTMAQFVRDAHFMLQREVVERMCALPGTKQYGRLSVMLQYRWRIESLFEVEPGAFRPAPKVWSSVARMVPHPTLPYCANDEKVLAEVVMRAFGQRRKTLRNALRELLALEDFGILGIDSLARGETLGVADFVRLSNFIAAGRQ